MIRLPKFALLSFCAAAFLRSASLSAQSLPADVGPAPSVGLDEAPLAGSFNYALNASELISNGFFNGGSTSYSTNLSGDAVYESNSRSHPFSLVYTGGVLLENSGQPTTTYQGLSLSQSLRTKNWNFNIQDAASFLPESPVSGLSGIPGVGDLGINPVPIGPQTGIGILTTYGPRVSNTVTGSASRYITAHLSAQASGYEDTQQFIGDNANEAVNNSGEGGSAGLTYRHDVRNTVSVNYNYSRFSFGNTYGAYIAQGVTVNYAHQWSRRLTTNAYVGPQFESSSDGLYSSSTQIAAGASASFNSRSTFYTLNYTRGVTNGSGVVPGSFADSVTAGVSRVFARVWNVSGDVGYSRVTALPGFQPFVFTSQGVAAGAQVARALSRRVYGYASYTVEEQSLGMVTGPAPNAFRGVYQIIAVGVSYSPRKFLFGR